jgi:hypothetical protein
VHAPCIDDLTVPKVSFAAELTANGGDSRNITVESSDDEIPQRHATIAKRLLL